MKRGMVVIAVATLAGCAGSRTRQVRCVDAPQWWVNDASGRPAIEVHVCFRGDGVLTYAELPVTTPPPVLGTTQAVLGAPQK